VTETKPKPCPICRKPRHETYAPFCSRRCEDIDLGRWLKGSYVIPGDPVDEDEDGPRSEEHPDGER